MPFEYLYTKLLASLRSGDEEEWVFEEWMHARDHNLVKGGGGAGKGRAGGAYPGLTTLRGATGGRGASVLFESAAH